MTPITGPIFHVLGKTNGTRVIIDELIQLLDLIKIKSVGRGVYLKA